MKSSILFAFALFTGVCFAQTDVELKINHEIVGQPFSFSQTGQNNLGHVFQLSRLEYYLTRFTIIHDGGQEITVDDSVVFLVQASDNSSLPLGNFNVTNIEGIRFHVGVHTPTNHEDPTLYSTAHPLGPKAPSMHWGWTAGYRFIALEGWGGDDFNQKIELHGLGDDNYHETTVMAGSNTVSGVAQIEIFADYSRGIENISVEGGVIVHGETGDAARTCTNFRDHVFTASSTASVFEEDINQLNVFPVPSLGTVNVNWASTLNPSKLELVNQQGQIVSSVDIKSITNYQLNITNPGVYILRIMGDQGAITQRQIVIQ